MTDSCVCVSVTIVKDTLSPLLEEFRMPLEHSEAKGQKKPHKTKNINNQKKKKPNKNKQTQQQQKPHNQLLFWEENTVTKRLV